MLLEVQRSNSKPTVLFEHLCVETPFPSTTLPQQIRWGSSSSVRGRSWELLAAGCWLQSYEAQRAARRGTRKRGGEDRAGEPEGQLASSAGQRGRLSRGVADRRGERALRGDFQHRPRAGVLGELRGEHARGFQRCGAAAATNPISPRPAAAASEGAPRRQLRLRWRLRDPRRFGSVLWTSSDPLRHKLLKDLGPEPLSKEFDADYLFAVSRKRKVAVKQFIMNSHIVVGVGNIYANEALFLAGIRPGQAAGRLSKPRYQRLVDAIKTVLRQAIREGGTTLRDFTASDGNPGYFQLQLNVYGRGDEPCPRCGSNIKSLQQGQRATYYCPHCQQ